MDFILCCSDGSRGPVDTVHPCLLQSSSSAHLCHFQFLHVGACHWHCLHHVQHSWLNNHILNMSLNVWWYPLVASDAWHISPVMPSIVCPLVYVCIHITIALQSASHLFEFGDLYLNTVTCHSCADYILTLPNGVPFRHMYAIFSLLLTFSFISSPRLLSTAPVPNPARLSPLCTAPHHPRASSAKLILF